MLCYETEWVRAGFQNRPHTQHTIYKETNASRSPCLRRSGSCDRSISGWKFTREKKVFNKMGAGDPQSIVSVEFEVFGNVQGLYFTKYCRDLGDQLQLGGWVKNSKRGTIVGKVNGPRDAVNAMTDWLSRTGSPGCKIERCELTNWESLSRMEMKNFSIRF